MAELQDQEFVVFIQREEELLASPHSCTAVMQMSLGFIYFFLLLLQPGKMRVFCS